jgi:hypothetical protein
VVIGLEGGSSGEVFEGADPVASAPIFELDVFRRLFRLCAARLDDEGVRTGCAEALRGAEWVVDDGWRGDNELEV